MRIDVFFGANQFTTSDVTGRVVAVIDVLRASTTIAVALANGAKAVVPFDNSEDAVLRAKQFERRDVKLAGERKMHAIPGFDLGNSPREFTREVVEGKTVLFTTTNGTGTLTAVQGARDVVVAGYVNFSAVLAMMRAAARSGTDVSIICAGRDRQEERDADQENEPRAIRALLHSPEDPQRMNARHERNEWRTGPTEQREERSAEQLPEDTEARAHVAAVPQLGEPLGGEHAGQEYRQEEERDADQLALHSARQVTAPGQGPAW